MTDPDPAQPPPLPPVEEPHRSRSRRRRSRAGSLLRGRIYLILFWFLIHAYNLVGYLNTPEYVKRDFAHREAPMAIITTSLFVGVMYRQPWARYLLLALLLFRLGATLIYVPVQTEAMLQNPATAIDVLFYPILAGCIIWGIKSIPSIRRLVTRTYE